MSKVTRRDVLRSGLILSGSTLLAYPGWAQTTGIISKAWDDQARPAIAPREKRLFDFGWRFTFGNAEDPSKDLDFGMGRNNFSKTGEFEFATAKFDDSKWRLLNLPHDWAVELPFVWDEELKSHGYKPLGRKYPDTSVGWYRRSFDVPAGDQGRKIEVMFDGAFRDALIFVNGCFIGRNDNGYTPFIFDISDFLLYGQKNYIVVRMDATYNDGWFYEGAGIYRHVWMIKQDKLHLGQWDSYVRTGMEGGAAVLELGTVVQNEGTQEESTAVRWTIRDGSGKTVATATAPAQQIGISESASYQAKAHIADPKLWSIESPTLYTTTVTVETSGKVRDAEEVDFGIRTVHFDAEQGFFLNGKRVPIQGTCNHQDHAGVGSAVPDRLQYFRMAVLKSMGSNAVRTSHNMPTPEWVQACDRMGMMMLCETRTMSAAPEAIKALTLMIKRYRNSPGIFLWSMGNEEWELEQWPMGAAIMDDMQRVSNELDPTRLCTAAVNGHYYTGISKVLEVEGFNYNLDAPDKYHQTHPKQPSIGTETASAISTRGVYRTDPLRNDLSAYDTNQPGWGETAETWWQFYAARPWLSGGFAWTGFDYRGEPTPYGWPSISSQFGIVDTCGYPKDTYYYYQSVWSTEPMLHVFPHWNFEGEEGKPISVWAYSNQEEVELLVNGKSLGVKKMPSLSHVEWTVPFEPGFIEARARNNGHVLLTQKRETTGKPVSIRLTADRTTIHADGEDLSMIRIEALDAQGRAVPTADDLIEFKITGDGALIGVGNGDPNCHESDQGSRRSLFNGLAQAIVQANKKPGTIMMEASTPGGHLKAATITITTQSAPLRPEVS
jgi:beta-galactosidase